MTQQSKRPEALRTSGGLRSDWRTKAACRDYPVSSHDPWDAGHKARKPGTEAEGYCSRCPVKQDCLLTGLENDRQNGGRAYMVFGGLTPWQRKALVRSRFRLGCPVCRSALVLTPEGASWQLCASCGITWQCRIRKPLVPSD